MFSKTCEYGIKAVLYIASQSLENKRVKIGDIVQNIDSPEAFTSKILGVLSKNEIISSQTGPNGGYEVKDENIHSLTIRSEEHTSELQSRPHLVCRLLLE